MEQEAKFTYTDALRNIRKKISNGEIIEMGYLKERNLPMNFLRCAKDVGVLKKLGRSKYEWDANDDYVLLARMIDVEIKESLKRAQEKAREKRVIMRDHKETVQKYFRVLKKLKHLCDTHHYPVGIKKVLFARDNNVDANFVRFVEKLGFASNSFLGDEWNAGEPTLEMAETLLLEIRRYESKNRTPYKKSIGIDRRHQEDLTTEEGEVAVPEYETELKFGPRMREELRKEHGLEEENSPLRDTNTYLEDGKKAEEENKEEYVEVDEQRYQDIKDILDGMLKDVVKDLVVKVEVSLLWGLIKIKL